MLTELEKSVALPVEPDVEVTSRKLFVFRTSRVGEGSGEKKLNDFDVGTDTRSAGL